MPNTEASEEWTDAGRGKTNQDSIIYIIYYNFIQLLSDLIVVFCSFFFALFERHRAISLSLTLDLCVRSLFLFSPPFSHSFSTEHGSPEDLACTIKMSSSSAPPWSSFRQGTAAAAAPEQYRFLHGSSSEICFLCPIIDE